MNYFIPYATLIVEIWEMKSVQLYRVKWIDFLPPPPPPPAHRDTNTFYSYLHLNVFNQIAQ